MFVLRDNWLLCSPIERHCAIYSRSRCIFSSHGYISLLTRFRFHTSCNSYFFAFTFCRVCPPGAGVVCVAPPTVGLWQVYTSKKKATNRLQIDLWPLAGVCPAGFHSGSCRLYASSCSSHCDGRRRPGNGRLRKGKSLPLDSLRLPAAFDVGLVAQHSRHFWRDAVEPFQDRTLPK